MIEELDINAVEFIGNKPCVKNLKYECTGCRTTFNNFEGCSYHTKKRICIQLRSEIDETFKEERLLSFKELWLKLRDGIKDAKPRNTAKGEQSLYVLLDLPLHTSVKMLTFDQFLKSIFYCGVAGNLKLRFERHIAGAKRRHCKFIPLNDKDTMIIDSLTHGRQIVPASIDGLTSNESSALEYSVIMDLQHILTNTDSSGQ
uniref:C2H2-type domain-containing protein n=1 Tax=Rhabditophanes sp. KR3021 TaxID=114890 RepID=A0AC35U6Z4_9BILA